MLETAIILNIVMAGLWVTEGVLKTINPKYAPTNIITIALDVLIEASKKKPTTTAEVMEDIVQEAIELREEKKEKEKITEKDIN